MFSIVPVDKSSITYTSSPRCRYASDKCEPIKPAPPVISTRKSQVLQITRQFLTPNSVFPTTVIRSSTQCFFWLTDSQQKPVDPAALAPGRDYLHHPTTVAWNSFAQRTAGHFPLMCGAMHRHLPAGPIP